MTRTTSDSKFTHPERTWSRMRCTKLGSLTKPEKETIMIFSNGSVQMLPRTETQLDKLQRHEN